MSLRRAAAAVSTLLLVLVSIAVAEAALLVLLLVFSSILELQLDFQLGDRFLQLWQNVRLGPAYAAFASVTVQRGGLFASLLFTFACGAGAAALRFSRWRPA